MGGKINLSGMFTLRGFIKSLDFFFVAENRFEVYNREFEKIKTLLEL